MAASACNDPSDERGKATAGCRALLRCGGRRCASTALRCSQRAGERRTRPRADGISLRELPTLGAQTGGARRLALRRSDAPPTAPLLAAAEAQRPTPDRGFAGSSELCIDEHSVRCCAQSWADDRRRASAASRSGGSGGLRVASRRRVERRLFEHRAQRACAARPRPREGEFGARPPLSSTAEQSACKADRRSEAPTGIRPRLGVAQTVAVAQMQVTLNRTGPA